MDIGPDKGVSILDGSSFFVSDSLGDAHRDKAQGMFFKDTRFLSTNILRINDKQPTLLSTKGIDYFSARFFMTMPFKDVEEQHPITIIRSRLMGRAATEQVLIENHSGETIDFVVTIECDADFADLFVVKKGTAQLHKRHITVERGDNRMTFRYEKDGLKRETIIEFSQKPILVENLAYFKVSLSPQQSWVLDFTICPVIDDEKHEPKYTMESFGKAQPEMEKSMEDWLADFPQLDSDMDNFVHTFNRSAIDMAALRFYPNGSKEPVVAGGLPWYMALFGRDNLISSYQTCFIAPELSEAALQNLAARQGTEVVDFRDEQPGKILHELRYDERTLEGLLPYGPYFGSADSTPLFLIVLHETYLWTGDDRLVRAMEPHVRRALKWIDEYADMDGDGYVEFHTKSSKGLRNQCWKDSWNSMVFHDGRLAEPPLAVAEIQGYVYDAKLRIAELAEHIWNDAELAGRLRAEAQRLRRQFNNDFWIDRRGGYFALALDKDKRQVDSRTSNMGQLLWTGIVDGDKADAVVQQLFNPTLYSGWGVRTLAQDDHAFNPIGYHIGTVWPHDNSLIAGGLVRYGYRDEANRIVSDLLDASHYFEYQLPEVFAGHQRSDIRFPVEYPSACAPQAWATGAPLLLLRTVLGLKADPINKSIEIDARLPETVKRFDLRYLRLYGKVFHIHADTNEQHVEVQQADSLDKARERRQGRRRTAS